MFAPWLAFVLVAAPAVTSTSARFDAAATGQALEVRLGRRADHWQVEVEDDVDGRHARVHLRSNKGEDTQRTFVVTGATTEERSRELAAALALVIEEYLPPEPKPTTAKPKPTPIPTPRKQPEGWLAVGARVGIGRPIDVAAGASLRGGALWGRRIVQPIGSLAWSRSRERGLVLDGVRFGAGVGVGADLPGTPLWLCGSVVPHAVWASARHTARDRGWTSATELSALLQVRAAWFFGALRVGADITAPPLRARGTGADLRWGSVRLLVGLELGLRLPPR
ncbi:MAG TPA: hypothetical protein VFG69_11830 [Nannocystaceae bacterium]|nr:hypothetical protein [Nannocystaceae bacterium]